jgi:hypothetical protein
VFDGGDGQQGRRWCWMTKTAFYGGVRGVCFMVAVAFNGSGNG